MARRDLQIPASVLANRGDLSPMQAMCIYLVDDEDGPALTQEAAAEVLGIDRREVSTHLSRARRSLEAKRS